MRSQSQEMETHATARVEPGSTRHRSFDRFEPNRVKRGQVAISNDGNATVGW